MRLKSLELQGFKTFPDKTKLTFEDGISAVVGPNGSGKSNISDALRWVLGEQSAKSLRCERMEDVIFSGTPGRKAQGFAEVTLTIDNESRYLPYDGDTVAVTRRYYRSGESEYLINKATVRLKDIHELFMDTGLGRDGYSMIGQGKIDSIISAKSEERREIFEEAAGISRYRYRKEESERKLARAEENLVRLQDIVGELEGRVGPLREQSEKAKTYLGLYEEKRRLEIGLWLYTLNQSGEILRQHEEKIAIARRQHEEVTAAAEALDRQIEALFQQSNQCLIDAEKARNAAAQAESDAAGKDGEISVLQNDIQHNRETIGRLTAEQTRFEDDAKQFRAQLEEKQEQLAQCDAQLREQAEHSQKAEEKRSALQEQMAVSGDQMEIANGQLQQLSGESAEAKLAAMQSASAAEELSRRIADLTAAIGQREAKQSALEAELAAARQADGAAQEEEAALQDRLGAAEASLADRATEREQVKEQRDRLYLDLQETDRRAKILEDLERNLEGFAHSVKTVMRMAEKGELRQIHGPVSRLLTVPREYAVAIETALGGAAQYIVVSGEEDAKQAIRLLKQRDGGRATFLPVSTIKGKVLSEPSLAQCRGFVGVAGDLCQCESQYRGIRESLLGRIAVAETLDDAVAIAKRFRYQFRVVTLDGQVVNAGGSMTGGSLVRKNGLLSRSAEIAALREKSQQIAGQYRQQDGQLARIDQDLAQRQASLASLRESRAAAAGARLEAGGALHRLESEKLAAQQQIAELKTERSLAEVCRADREAAREQAEQRQAQLAAQMLRAQAELGKISGGRLELQQQSEELAAQMQELRIRLLTVQKDRETLSASAAELEEKIQESAGRARHIAGELDWTARKIEGLEAEIESSRKASQELRETASAQKQAAQSLAERRMALEQKASSLRAMEKEQSATRETISAELSRLEERKDGLQKRYDEIIEQLWTEYELTRREAESQAEPVEDEARSARRLRELKNKIKALGSVNVSAIEEYAEVSERYEFLTKQVADVEQSRTELHRLIRDLTQQMAEIFTRQFGEIDRYFGATFAELFGGGKARLELSDPEDILHSGIAILAQPPGKIVRNLESLSGGEKALVAIALYFSIMKVSPPPFCMLDEIEAALDDVNVVRFAEYLRHMNQNTQFIVVTHRRGTMEEADVLYGVTMQEEGVSKLLKLDPSEIGSRMGVR